ncbi:MAG: PilZ domain-containing protein [Elusimicrobiota bacterium]
MTSERKHERVATLVLLNVQNMDTTQEAVRAAVVNISSGGVAFETFAEFGMGSRIMMRFILPKGDMFVFEGILRRVSRGIGVYSYGLEFNDMNSADRKKLKKLISKVKKR